MYILILNTLKCFTTEDVYTDECRLEVYLDGELSSPPLKCDMQEGQTWELNRQFHFNNTAEVKLWDEDSPDPDDFLGSTTIQTVARTNGSALFTHDEARYKLSYDVTFIPQVQVNSWEEALDNFIRSNKRGVWTYINRTDLIAGIKARVENLPASAYKVHQRGAPLCGPAAIVFELISRDPARYISICQELYESGVFHTRTKRVAPRDGLLKSKPRSDMHVADWMVLGALRDTENDIHPYPGEGYENSEKIAGITYPWEMEGWTKDLLCFDRVKYESFVFYGELDAMRRARRIRNSGGVAFMMIHSAMVGKPEPLVSTPNHWVSFVGGLLIAEGSDTYRDTGHIEFNVYTWGESYPVDLDEGKFEDHFWGLVTGEEPSLSGVGSGRQGSDDNPIVIK